MKLYFSPINAKDSPSGYTTVAFVTDQGQRPVHGPKNAHLGILMQREYLTQLATLQARIRDKYLVLYDTTEPVIPPKGAYYDGLSEADYNSAVKSAEFCFPGCEADYYM